MGKLGKIPASWKRRVTRSMVRCDKCEKRISIVEDWKDGDAIVIRETSKEERTYYEKGKTRLCPSCYNWIVNGVKPE